MNFVEKTIDANLDIQNKRNFAEQLVQVVESLSVPQKLIFEIFENIDESVALKIKAFNTEYASSPPDQSKLEALFFECLSGLSAEVVATLKI